jgi:hypothetical protein
MAPAVHQVIAFPQFFCSKSNDVSLAIYFEFEAISEKGPKKIDFIEI